MLRLVTALLAAGLLAPPALPLAESAAAAPQAAARASYQEGRARRRGRDYGRRRGGVVSAYRRAGRSAVRGGAGFGKDMARGRPVRAGKRLGKGVGGAFKHGAVGTARAGKKLGRGIRRVF